MDVYYNGCLFESTLELKYALSIEDEYAYIVHPKRIFDSFYRDNGKLVEILEQTKSYTPDFLIRSYTENKASIIEIKEEHYSDPEQYDLRNRIMKKYTEALENPPDFKWVFWNDGMLTPEKTEKFHLLMSCQGAEKKFYELLKQLYQRNEKIPYTFPRTMSTSEYMRFLVYGDNPATE